MSARWWALGLAVVGAGVSCRAVFAQGAAAESDFDRAVLAVAAAHPSMVTAGSIGRSREGRTLHVLRVAGPGAEPDDRPALLIVAALDGRYGFTSDVALAVVGRLAAEGAAALEGRTVYVVPRANPDAVAWHDGDGRPAWDSGRTATPDDADRDGRTDEDGPADLNGDGRITMMRVADPAPGAGLTATHMIDPDNPRLMKTPDRAKGDRATHALLVESADADGDGLFGEDGPGGVDLDMNFPALWPEHQDGSGPYQLSEPETLALASWVLSRENIVAALVFGPHDTLITVPDSGRFDDSGRVPLGLEPDDRPLAEELSRLFKETTRMTAAPTKDAAGSFHAWAYAHAGILSFSTPVWVRPDQLKPPDAPAEPAKPDPADPPAAPSAPAGSPDDSGGAEARARIAEFMSATPERQAQMIADFRRLPPEEQARITTMAGAAGVLPPGAAGGQPGGGQPGQPGGPAGPGGGRRFGRGGGGGGAPPGAPPPSGASPDDAKWLTYSDEQRDKQGFAEWTPFDHPQLGPVEIGGFVPGFRVTPPASELDRLASEQAAFAGIVLSKLPVLSVPRVAVTRLDNGLWKINARVVNEGYLPTRSAIGVKTNRLAPTRLRLDVPIERLVSGRAFERAPAIAGSGGTAEAEWIITGREGDRITLQVLSPELGDRRAEFVLEGGDR